MRHLKTIAILAAVGFATACSDSPSGPGTGVPAALNADVASVAAAGVSADVEIMAGMNGLPRTAALAFRLPPTDPGNTEGCTFGGESWTCARTRVNGLDVVRTITFRDLDGASQEHYDAENTASIDVSMTVDGDIAVGHWTATIARDRALAWTGLAGTETTRTVNGNGTEDVTRARFNDSGASRSYDIDGTFTIANVVMPVRAPGIDPWPLSGTVTRTYTVTRSTGETITRIVVITFNGTSTPTATVNGESFEIDLANRTAHRR